MKNFLPITASNKEKIVCISNIGKRSKHEDNFLIDDIFLNENEQEKLKDNKKSKICEFKLKDKCIFAISDGMGGHNAGEVASRICVEMLAEAKEEIQNINNIENIVSYLKVLIGKINDKILELGNKDVSLKGMGATLVIFVYCNDKYAILNIGDSRAYVLCQNSLVQITKDHTEGQRLLDLGILSRKELNNLPSKKRLNHYIGCLQNDYILEIDVFYPIFKKGVVMLCSDGISDNVLDDYMYKVLTCEKKLKTAALKIMERATSSSNADNATLMLIPLGGEL